MRRSLLLALGALALALPPARAQEPARTPRRPNVVLIYTDDQRYDSLGVVQREQGGRGRFPWIRTPHLDRLAAEGVRFRNAFVVNSLCSPSRASFLTGRYGHENGVVNNHTPFPETAATVATLLRAAGYRTGYVGKWHMGPQRGPRPGFDRSASFIGQGRYVDCPFELDGRETPTKGWVDDVSTDYAIDFLREHRDRPFLLFLGFKAAHGPFDPPPRHARTYDGETARPVPNLDLPPAYSPDADPAPRAAGPRPTNLGYFRCLAAADDNVGRVLTALDNLGLAEDTIVVYASDNGFYLGEHRLGDKRSAYDESLRIPLIVRYPRGAKAALVEDRMALNVDFVPTVLDYAGVQPPADLPGRSWRPLLEGKPADWRDAWFYAYFYERGFRIPTVTAVRTETAKLVRYPGHDDWTELFDLAADPYETRNLWNDPDKIDLQRTLNAAYDRERDAVRFAIPPFADNPTEDPPPPRSPRARNAWVLDYRFDRDTDALARDASPAGLDARVDGAPLEKDNDGRPARRFEGRGVIDVPRGATLDPSVAGWTVEATLLPDGADGTVLAHGGQNYGYALTIVAGRPRLTLRAGGQTKTTEGPALAHGKPAVLGIRLHPDGVTELLVDGETVARSREPAPMRNPNEGLQIGADLGTQVVDPPAPRFRGRLLSVRVYSGLAP
jgi:arylsulfatase A-like enzyme